MDFNCGMTQEEVSKFYKIVREELEARKLIWDNIAVRSKLRIVTEARWAIIWRLKTEMNFTISRISNLLEMDRTTIRNAIIKMEKTGGKYWENKGPVCHETDIRTKLRLKRMNAALGLSHIAP